MEIELFRHYGYLIGGCVLGIVGWCLAVWYIKRTPAPDYRRFKWHYVLVGPFLFDLLHAEIAKRGQLVTRRELIGWGIVLIIIIVAIFINPTTRGR
jgi:hypothetical protein